MMKTEFKSVRIWAFILSILTVLSCFASCKKGDSTETDKNHVASDCIDLSDFRIVYPSELDRHLFGEILKVRSTVEKIYGVNLEVTDDFLRDGESSDGTHEILIGNTGRPESKARSESLGFMDYSIGYADGKIVLASHTEETFLKSIRDFCQLLETNRTKENRFNLETEVLKTSETEGLFESHGGLGQYRIVYPKGNDGLQKLCKSLASRIKREFGVELDTVSDGELPSGHEILVGMTNRAVFADYYRGNKMPDGLHFAVSAKGGCLLILSGDSAKAEVSVNRFCKEFISSVYSNRFDFPAEFETVLPAYAYDADSRRTDGTDIRAMSYNVLSEELTPEADPFSKRADMVLGTILNYAPDIVGMQEVSAEIYSIVEDKIGSEYAFTQKKIPNGQYSFTTLLYNKKTLRLTDSGNVVYSLGNKRIRVMSWGVFEKLSDGTKFAAVSTHWDVVLDHRQPQSVEITDFVNHLKKTYHCPVISMGDFNTRESVPYFKDYLQHTGQSEARYSAKTVAHASKEEVIDHICATDETAQALLFKLIDTPLTQKASDHNPIYADYQFRSPQQ